MNGSLETPRSSDRRRGPQRLRVALYSHDAQGLGHVRRNLAIAGALAVSELAPDILLLNGTPYAREFDLPPRTDCLTLPALQKSLDGTYTGRFDPPLLLRVRAEAIGGALAAFDADLLIVDKLPRGAFNELQPALNHRRRSGGRTVLGLRDILDTPTATIWEWQQARANEAIAEHYDAVWVYGDPRVYDPVTQYGFPQAVASKVSYTGYLAPQVQRPLTSGPPLVLCVVGGGQDGYGLARTFLESDLPTGVKALLVTGPHMPTVEREHLERIAAERGQRQVRRFIRGTLDLLLQAHAVVSMGGYNTVCEILASGVPAFIVPRTTPRQEQSLRAHRLQALGAVDTASLDTLTAPRLSEWIQQTLERAPRHGAVIDTDGLSTVRHLAASLCGRSLAEAGRAAS